MISSINIKNIASYKNEVKINTNAKINLFYGLNGSGKTTLTRYLSDISHEDFKECSIYPHNVTDEREIFVYNQDYIDKNFYQNNKQQGIFTIGKDAVDAEQAIDIIEDKLQRINGLLQSLEKEKEKKQGINSFESDNLKDKLFKRYKNGYEKSKLHRCLQGSQTKDGVLNRIRTTPLDIEINYTFEDLEQEEAKLQNNKGKEESLLPLLMIEDLSNIISNDIWKTSIIGLGQSNLSETIKKLNNHDWIIKGESYLIDSDGACPFCQEQLPIGFIEQLYLMFDESYEKSLAELNKVYSLFQNEEKKVRQFFEALEGREAFLFVDTNEYFKIKDPILSKLQTNRINIDNKKSAPSASIELIDLIEGINELNELLNSTNIKIGIFNEQIRQFKKSEQKITDKFWRLARKESDEELKTREDCRQRHIVKITLYNNQITRLRKIEASLLKEKDSKLSETTNIEEAKNRINSRLSSLGVEGFVIESVTDIDGHWYRLIRDGEISDSTFKTLSEGEKTLITFVYFIESVLGAGDKQQSVDLLNRIVVIDDPISSLSHNYIYDIARLIKNIFLTTSVSKNAKDKTVNSLLIDQLFVLTHNLYFFHELLMQGVYIENNRNLYRIIKNENSRIVKIKKHEVLNHYQENWLIFKESTGNPMFLTVLPNVMRNILEEFFSFVHKKKDLKIALEELTDEDADFKPLERYINRESHSDLVNLSEFKNIDPEKYRRMFRRVFEKMNHVEHYDVMMQ